MWHQAILQINYIWACHPAIGFFKAPKWFQSSAMVENPWQGRNASEEKKRAQDPCMCVRVKDDTVLQWKEAMA